ncbi:MAG: IS200/IS605 family element transposase accessory protein TnpB [Pyrinomonadaceae bacterium]|nr:IS200/IS605 family element transposase accessory protein TnpB [Pyrinomonadaceae bacterium]
MRKTYKYRLYPTRSQVALLESQLSEACRLYNAALQERRDAWRLERKSITCFDQTYQLKDIRAAGDTDIQGYDVAQEVLQRVDKAFKGFFRRVKRGERAGFPRFKSLSRYDSFTFTHYGRGCRLLDNNKLRLQGIGQVKLKLHRSIEGKIKTLTVRRDAGKWYACFVVECEENPLPLSSKTIGLDVGISAFATLSDGTEIANPRYFEQSQAKLRKAQRKVSRRKKGSNRRRKAIQLLQRIHAHIRNQRADFHHKVSHALVNQYGLIAIENLNVKGLAKSHLAKQVNDAGWSAFINKLAEKAEEAARVLIKVDPRGTSQRCVCGADVPKTLAQRWHECQSCGLSVSRDHASAMEILRLGLSLHAPTSPITECVA